MKMSSSAETTTPIAQARRARRRSCASQIARREDQHDERQQQRLDGVQSLGAALGGLQLIRSQQDDPARIRRQGADAASDGGVPGDPADERPEIEHDLAVRRRQGPVAVIEEAVQLTARALVREAPCPLGLGRGEHALRALHEHVPQARCGRGRERLRARGQRVAQLARDVDVRVELIDEVRRERLPDLGVLQDLGTRVGPRRRIQGDAPDPQRQRAGGEQDRREHHEAAHAPQASPARPRRCVVRRLVPCCCCLRHGVQALACASPWRHPERARRPVARR